MAARERRRAAALAVALVLLVLPACGSRSHDQSLLGDGSGPSASTATAAHRPTSEPGLLRQRAAAVRTGDEQAFLATVEPGRPRFLADQRRLFANLRQLPVEHLWFTMSSAGHHVLRHLTLGGFDSRAVVGPAGFDVRRQGGRLVVAPPSATDERATDPWDLASIRVLSTARVLLVAGKDTSAAELTRVLDAMTSGVSLVGDTVPSAWDGTAVVYLFRDPAVLASYDRVPGGNLEHLGALTFPVRGGTDGDQVVGSRVALLPAALGTDSFGLRRLLRHELTHVALGTADDDAPTWLVEGIAEYVAAKSVSPNQLRIATSAVDRAESGLVGLPDAASFNGRNQDLHYAEAWMACDYLAATRGEGVLFDLLDAMDSAHVGRAGHGQDAVLRSMVGMDSAQLARRAGQRIVRMFGTEPSTVPTVTDSPQP